MNRKALKVSAGFLFAAALIFLNGCDFAGSGRPEILSIRPADGATGIDRNTDILITFSEPMDPESCEKRFQLMIGARTVFPSGEEGLPGRFYWDNYSQTMTFDPDSALGSHMDYSIILKSGMKAHHDGHSMNLMGMRDHGLETDSGIISMFNTE
ncbi:MAG: Ig-like domain-containing protein [FCB group bacterium]|nr:Ig-like domain-containing protein [FCB group bacterium]